MMENKPARIIGSCTIVDLKRVIEAAAGDPEKIPEGLFKAKGKIALAFVLMAQEGGMSPGDLEDVKEVRLWSNGNLEAMFFPEVGMAKRAKWREAIGKAEKKMLENYPIWKLRS